MSGRRRLRERLPGPVKGLWSGAEESAAPAEPASAPPAPRGPLAPVRSLLPRGHRDVVVLTDLDAVALEPWLRPFGHDDVTVLDPASGVEDVVEALRRRPPPHVLLDLRAEPAPPRAELWEHTFLFLAHGGAYVVGRVAPGTDLRLEERAWLVGLGEETGPDSTSQHRECLRSLLGHLQRPDLLVLQKQWTHRLKLRPGDVPDVLAAREPGIAVRELARIEATRLESAVEVVEHAATDDEEASPPPEEERAHTVRTTGAMIEVDKPPMATSYDVPEMRLQHLTGDLVFAGQTLMYTPGSVLPDSFRYPYAEHPHNPYLHHSTAPVAAVYQAAAPVGRLEGDYYQLDPQWSGHFGHLMTEVVGRLWGWDRAKQELPDLKALFRARPGSPRGPVVERELLRAWGIADDDVVWIEEPVRVDSLVSATVMWHNFPPRYAHPGLTEVWRRLGEGLRTPDAPRHDRIFVSRADDLARRRCTNRAAVEELFARHGFAVVHPERHTLGEQATMFAHASHVAGFGGSGMFNLMFAERLDTTIVLSHDSYWARNEHMYTALRGGTAHYFWSTPDVAPPPGGWSFEASSSAWAFDLARHEAALTELLRGL